LELRLVLFLGVLDVQDAVLLLPEVHAEEAVTAANAVKEEGAIAAVRAIFGPEKPFAVVAIVDVVASAALMREREIAAVLAFLQPIAVQTILVVAALEDEVAIPAIGDEVAVFGILDIGHGHVHAWHSERELMELLEERARKIKVTAILERIPPIPPPFLVAVDLYWLIGRKFGDDLLAGEIAFAVIQASFVTLRMAALPATIRAEGRRRECFFLAIKCRR
jgi:limonene-1,2-epoxide hydrolase